jgi:hypothetical protein
MNSYTYIHAYTNTHTHTYIYARTYYMHMKTLGTARQDKGGDVEIAEAITGLAQMLKVPLEGSKAYRLRAVCDKVMACLSRTCADGVLTLLVYACIDVCMYLCMHACTHTQVKESNVQTRRLIERVGQLEAWRHEMLEEQQARELELQQLKAALRETSTAYESLVQHQAGGHHVAVGSSEAVAGQASRSMSGGGGSDARGPGGSSSAGVTHGQAGEGSAVSAHVNSHRKPEHEGRLADVCVRGGPLQELCVMLGVDFELHQGDVRALLTRLCDRVRQGGVQVRGPCHVYYLCMRPSARMC